LWIAEDLGAAPQADGEYEVRGHGLKHQKEKRSMDHFAGLDVSVKETSVCIVDDTGKIVREVKIASEPEALLAVLSNPDYHFKRIGLEAGPLSQWLYSALTEADLPVICVETRHMQAVLKAQINKTDRNDARGIAQMMRVGLYRPVHVKTLRSQKLRMLLTNRKLLQSKAIAIENDLRGTLRNFGLKVGIAGKVKFEARIKELVERFPDLAVLVEPLLVVRRVLREQLGILHRRLLVIVRDDDVCRRLMTVPGVGPVVALTYRATVDVPVHFRKSKAVGAVFGLTPSKYQSGEIDRTGAISRCGDTRVTGLSWARALPFPFCARLANVQVWISGNNGPRMVREGLYLLCVDREVEPGFGHTDQVSLAFRLTLGLYLHVSNRAPDREPSRPMVVDSLKVLDLVWSLLRPFNYRESS
jgi:transposase